VPLRFTHIVLASLLLFAQMATPVMQLCLEENGSLSVELANQTWRTSIQTHDDEVCYQPPLRSGAAAAEECKQLHEEDCPCSDYGLSFVVRGSKDWGPVTFDLPAVLTLELPQLCFFCKESTPANLVPVNGRLSLAWLEHGDVLAKHHGAHAVVMNC